MAATSARESDSNGFMTIRGCPLSREGVYEYSANQVYPEGHPDMGDPHRIIGVYRPDYAIREQAAIDSFKSIPFINEHEMLAGDTENAEHPDDVAPEEKGIDGVLTDNVYYDESDGWLKGDIKAFGRKAQDAIKKGKDNLSLGFGCQFRLKKGVFNGKPYEVIQDTLRGNHLANVAEARVEGARILDARCFDSANLNLTVKTTKETEMATKTKPKAQVIKRRVGDSAEIMEQLKAIVPALQKIVNSGSGADATDCMDEDQDLSPVDGDDSNAAAPVDDTNSDEDGGDEAVQEDAGGDDGDDAGNIEGADEGEEPGGDDGDADLSGGDDQSQGGDGDVVAQAKELLEAISAVLGQGQAQDEDDAGEDGDDDVDGSAMDEEMRDNDLVKRAADAAVKRVNSEAVKKQKLYDRLSNVIGAFNGVGMDSKTMAQYGLKKLGVKATPGQEDIVLDSYLNGMASQQKDNAKVVAGRAADSRVANSQLDAWLNEGNK